MNYKKTIMKTETKQLIKNAALDLLCLVLLLTSLVITLTLAIL